MFHPIKWVAGYVDAFITGFKDGRAEAKAEWLASQEPKLAANDETLKSIRETIADIQIRSGWDGVQLNKDLTEKFARVHEALEAKHRQVFADLGMDYDEWRISRQVTQAGETE